jgi:hypothetical protein
MFRFINITLTGTGIQNTRRKNSKALESTNSNTSSTMMPVRLRVFLIRHHPNFRSHKFNVFHVRALYYTKKKALNTNECTKRFFVNYNTLLDVSTLLGHPQGESFRCRYTRLHYTVERECAVDCALRRLWRRELFVVSACTSSLNCIVQPSVTTTEGFSLKMTQQGRNM